jgi:hypothetical protein
MLFISLLIGYRVLPNKVEFTLFFSIFFNPSGKRQNGEQVVKNHIHVFFWQVGVISLLTASTFAALPHASSMVTRVSFQQLDFANVACRLANNGIFAMNPNGSLGGLEYPKGSGKTLIYSAGLWFSGKVDGEIRAACGYYSTDFTPGRIRSDGTPADSADPTFSLYKIMLTDKTESNPDLKNWPWQYGAPVDLHTLQPLFWGEQQVWGVFNDLGSRQISYSRPFGLEIHLLGWVENPDMAGNVIYLCFDLINKGLNTIQDAYLGFFVDNDLGSAVDDYVGCDTTLDLAYGYNGNDTDKVYGVNPPAVGLLWLQGAQAASPGDTARLIDGRVLPEQKCLAMSSFNGYS